MAYLRLQITYDENLVTARAHNRLMNRLYREALERHKQISLPKHFKDVPETRPFGAYGYAPRSAKWKKRKQHEGRSAEPNVYSGRMRQIVTSNSVVRATREHGTLTVRNYFPLTEQRRDEVEAISVRETNTMLRRMERDYATLAKTPEFARKRAPKKLKS